MQRPIFLVQDVRRKDVGFFVESVVEYDVVQEEQDQEDDEEGQNDVDEDLRVHVNQARPQVQDVDPIDFIRIITNVIRNLRKRLVEWSPREEGDPYYKLNPR